MDISRIFVFAFCCVFVADPRHLQPVLLKFKNLKILGLIVYKGLPSARPTKTDQQKDLEVLEKESEVVPPVEILKEVTFIHKYNDTDAKEGNQSVSSKINSFGGLENRIQNLGGIQKTVLNNKIQYNFYFWLVPKNFTRPSEAQEKR